MGRRRSETQCWDYTGPGGGGAGGSILLQVDTAELGSSLVRALGGAGGNGVDGNSGNGGQGGQGRIFVNARTRVTGTSDPIAIAL